MPTHAATPVLAVIERLLRRIDRLDLPDNWATLTPAQLQLDSLDLVELQLELETACDVTLLEDDVTGSPLSALTFEALAAHVTARKGQGAPG